jgi:hypothetical protein
MWADIFLGIFGAAIFFCLYMALAYGLGWMNVDE